MPATVLKRECAAELPGGGVGWECKTRIPGPHAQNSDSVGVEWAQR